MVTGAAELYCPDHLAFRPVAGGHEADNYNAATEMDLPGTLVPFTYLKFQGGGAFAAQLFSAPPAGTWPPLAPSPLPRSSHRGKQWCTCAARSCQPVSGASVGESWRLFSRAELYSAMLFAFVHQPYCYECVRTLSSPFRLPRWDPADAEIEVPLC